MIVFVVGDCEVKWSEMLANICNRAVSWMRRVARWRGSAILDPHVCCFKQPMPSKLIIVTRIEALTWCVRKSRNRVTIASNFYTPCIEKLEIKWNFCASIICTWSLICARKSRVREWRYTVTRWRHQLQGYASNHDASHDYRLHVNYLPISLAND